jgi:hypothetical protein
MGPCIVNVIYKYNQQDATLYNILYYCQCSTCFRRFLRPSLGAQSGTHSIGNMSSLLAATANVGELQITHASICYIHWYVTDCDTILTDTKLNTFISSLHCVHLSHYQYLQSVVSIQSVIIYTAKQDAKCVSNPMLQSNKVKTLSIISNGNNAIDLCNKIVSFIIKILHKQQQNEENWAINSNTHTWRCRKL